jgi:FKBP-type peptidyl-prolyl cis-trans isomerase
MKSDLHSNMSLTLPAPSLNEGRLLLRAKLLEAFAEKNKVAEAERKAKEAERKAKEAERKAKETERKAKEAEQKAMEAKRIAKETRKKIAMAIQQQQKRDGIQRVIISRPKICCGSSLAVKFEYGLSDW